jgi:hypothetical protein
MLPSFRHKLVNGRESRCFRWVDVLASLHCQSRVTDWGVFQHSNGLKTVWSTAMWDGCIFESNSNIEWHNGIESKRLVHAVLPVSSAKLFANTAKLTCKYFMPFKSSYVGSFAVPTVLKTSALNFSCTPGSVEIS